MARGQAYADALAAAQREGLAERDPSADVDGHDAVAKAMVLSGLVFGRQLRLEDVSRIGISSVTEEAVSRAISEGKRIREITTVEGSAARVEPVALEAWMIRLPGSTAPTTPWSVARTRSVS